MKKWFLFLAILVLSFSAYSQESKFADYFLKTFQGNMMGKIITADMKILEDESIEFAVNTPGDEKKHYYTTT